MFVINYQSRPCCLAGCIFKNILLFINLFFVLMECLNNVFLNSNYLIRGKKKKITLSLPEELRQNLPYVYLNGKKNLR